MEELDAFKLYLLSEQKGKKRVRSQRTVELHLQLLTRLKTHTDLSPVSVMQYLLALSEKGRKGTYLNDKSIV